MPLLSSNQSLAEELTSKLQAGRETPRERRGGLGWAAFRDTVHTAAFKAVGPSIRKQQDRFDENQDRMRDLLQKKHRLHRAHLSDPTSSQNQSAHPAGAASNTGQPA